MNHLDTILNGIEKKLCDILLRCGIMFRIFSRAKSERSIRNKIEKKKEKYNRERGKMQDLLALRVTLYFSDDVEIVHQYLKNHPDFVNESVDVAEIDRFCPKRLNIVMRIPEEYKQEMNYEITQTEHPDLIDDTYEIQIRTILSEGWHEVEHDLRYKCQDDWEGFNEESRLLNGVYATLESAEWSMLTLFDKLSYKHYKNKKWTSMIRTKMRLRFKDDSLSPELQQYLDDNHEIAKNIFRANRNRAMSQVIEKGFSFPITYDTTIYLLNHIGKIDKCLSEMADPMVQKELDLLFGPF